jgi:hypothetical protein
MLISEQLRLPRQHPPLRQRLPARATTDIASREQSWLEVSPEGSGNLDNRASIPTDAAMPGRRRHAFDGQVRTVPSSEGIPSEWDSDSRYLPRFRRLGVPARPTLPRLHVMGAKSGAEEARHRLGSKTTSVRGDPALVESDLHVAGSLDEFFVHTCGTSAARPTRVPRANAGSRSIPNAARSGRGVSMEAVSDGNSRVVLRRARSETAHGVAFPSVASPCAI